MTQEIPLLLEHLIARFETLIADIHTVGASNQLVYLFHALFAKGAARRHLFFMVGLAHVIFPAASYDFRSLAQDVWWSFRG